MEFGLVFTYVLTYGGATLSIFKPFVGLMVYFAFAIITPESMWHWAVPPGHYSRTVALALLAGWVIQGFGTWKFYGAKPLVYAIVGFWVWSSLSARTCEHVSHSMPFITSFAKILLPILVGATTIHTVGQIKALAWTLALSQAYIAYEFNVAYVFHNFNRVTAPIAYANMDNNSLCIAMVTGCGLVFFLALRDKVLWRRWLLFVLAALLAHVPMFGESRGAMLALVVTGFATFIIIPREPKHYAIFILAIVIGLRMAGPAVVERFATIFVEGEERDYSAQSRLDLWKGCADLMLQHPLLGVGPDNWPLYAPEYGFPKGKEAHSVWFQTGAEVGLPGLGFLLTWYVLTCWKLWRLIRRPGYIDPFLIDAARMVIAALVAFGVSASFVSLEGLELPYYVTLLGVCTIKIATSPKHQREVFLKRQQEAEALYAHAPIAATV